jgi:hypothetical protein
MWIFGQCAVEYFEVKLCSRSGIESSICCPQAAPIKINQVRQLSPDPGFRSYCAGRDCIADLGSDWQTSGAEFSRRRCSVRGWGKCIQQYAWGCAQSDGRAAGTRHCSRIPRMVRAMRFSKSTPWTGRALVRAAVLVSSVLFGAATATAASTGCTSVNGGSLNGSFLTGVSPACNSNTCTTSNVAGLTFAPGDTINYSINNDDGAGDGTSI